MAQNDPHVALIVLTTHTWGEIFWWQKLYHSTNPWVARAHDAGVRPPPVLQHLLADRTPACSCLQIDPPPDAPTPPPRTQYAPLQPRALLRLRVAVGTVAAARAGRGAAAGARSQYTPGCTAIAA